MTAPAPVVKALKRAGFKKRATYFRRTRDSGLIDVVRLREDGALTVGVYFPAFAYGRVTEAPQEFDCVVSRTFVVATNEAWTADVAPFLASVTDVASLHRALDEPGAVGPRYDVLRPARIALDVGDREAAQRRLDALVASIQAKRTTEGETFGAVVLQETAAFARRHGLVLR